MDGGGEQGHRAALRSPRESNGDGTGHSGGRTTEALDKTFGLVIFEAETEEAARLFMESDPVVVANIMTGTLHPSSVALLRRP